MGSSVLHGGFSTFLSIIVMKYSKLYSVQVFYKSWVCIIGFGMLNGLILLPVLLSLVGPIPPVYINIDDENYAKNGEII